MPDVIKGKYQIVREIARSNDIVYEAVDTTFGRKIAVKELNISAGASGQARRERIERFNREARAAGRLSHPNIVSVYDYGEENGRYFIAMEFLEGQSLRDAMQARGAYPLHEALAIVYQVLDALSYAHANRVIHRDIKPDNIHILPGGHAKITDFGIARLSEEPALTGDGQVFGTPSYMSPEQIEGKSIDYRSDLFSAGILLYEMLAGRKPFQGDSVISITYAIMHSEPPPLGGIPQGIDQVIRRALSKQAQMRQASADQMKLDLKTAEQTPALFLPAAHQTGMGFYPNQTGSGYTGQQIGYGYSPQSTGYTTGYQPGASGPITGYAPPQTQQANQPGGNLLWSWNTPGSNNNAAAQPQQQYTQAQPGGAQPPAGTPYPYASPPFPAIKPPPVIVLSPEAKTAVRTVMAAVVLGAIVAFTVIAVQKSYDNYNLSAQQTRVTELIKQGDAAYSNGDYNTAISLFEKAQNASPSDQQRPIVSTNLAYALVKRARLESAGGNLSQAKSDYEAALQAMPDYTVAHQELARILQQTGDTSGAQEHQAQADTGGSGTMQAPPSKLDASSQAAAPVDNQRPNQYVSDQRQAAQQLINEGDELSSHGDYAGARDKWTEATAKAPGTPESDQANQRLYQGTPEN